MLRVLHIITDTNIGGAGRHLLTFLQHYDRSRLQVEVLCPPGSLLIDRCRQLGVTTYSSPYLTGDRSLAGSRLIGLLREVRQLIRTRAIDIVHTHAAFAGRLAARLAGTKGVVYTKHRLDWTRPGWPQKALTWLNQITCDRVIAISQAVQEALIAEGMPASHIVLIYNGINVEAFQQEARLTPREICRAQLGLGNSPVVGIAARLEPEKGHRCFLETAAQILQRSTDPVKFLIVGGGSQAAELRELAQNRQIADQVVFTGFREDIPALLAAMDVVVVPSLTEAFGLSLVEAMALAKPCVASAVGGLREIATDGQTALLIPPGDAEALAEKVLYLLRNQEEAAALGTRAAQEVEQRFSATRMVEELTDLYLSLGEGSRGKRC